VLKQTDDQRAVFLKSLAVGMVCMLPDIEQLLSASRHVFKIRFSCEAARVAASGVA
jgi:hypothetical protein